VRLRCRGRVNDPRPHRIVGIRDDATKRKLLQMRKLDLNAATDICRASELATRQLKVMTVPEEVHALGQSSSKHTSTNTGRFRSKDRTDSSRRRDSRPSSKGRRCVYCGKQHDASKQACPAYGVACRKCAKKNHFEAVCKSKAASSRDNCV
jgi:hypothetical protein